jgi:hypothetical protein
MSSREHALSKALIKADARDRKHKKRMPVTGTSVFALRKLLHTKHK